MSINLKKIGYFGLTLSGAFCSEMTPLNAMEVVANEGQQKIDRKDTINIFDSFNINKKTDACVQAAKNTIVFLKNKTALLEKNSKEKINLIISAASYQIENNNKLNTNNINIIIQDLDNNLRSIATEGSNFQEKPLEIFKNLVSIELKARNLEELGSLKGRVEIISEEEILCLLNKKARIGKNTLNQSYQLVWNSTYKNTDDISDKNVIILANLICDASFEPLTLDEKCPYNHVYSLLENICEKDQVSIYKSQALYYRARFVFEETDNLDLDLTDEEINNETWELLEKAKQGSDSNFIKIFMAHLIIAEKFIPGSCDNLNQAYEAAAILLGETENKAVIKNKLTNVQRTQKLHAPINLKIRSQFDKKKLLDKCLENINGDSKKRKSDDLIVDNRNKPSSATSEKNRKKRKVENAGRKPYHRLTDSDKERILELDILHNMTHQKIADDIGCSASRVGDIIRNKG